MFVFKGLRAAAGWGILLVSDLLRSTKVNRFEQTIAAFAAFLVVGSVSAQEWSYYPYVLTGWNQLGNPLNKPINVIDLIGSLETPISGVTANIEAAWAYRQGQWAFVSPGLSYKDNASHAAQHGYAVLAVIDPGEGFWVRAEGGYTNLPLQTGELYDPGKDFEKRCGWTLMASPGYLSPEEFNTMVATTPPQPGYSQPSFESLWAWDTNGRRFYFYSPLLSPQRLAAYTAANGLGNFALDGRGLELGKSAWVNPFCSARG